MKRFVTVARILTICLSVLLVSRADAQFSEVQLLVGSGYKGKPQQGVVALSSDGNTAIIGGIADSGAQGAVWVFTRSGGVWSQQGNKFLGTGNTGAALQGCAVALSSDGNTAIVGGQSDNSNFGAAWVFTRTGGVWSQQGSKLVGTGGSGSPQQGFSVALSADGNTALIGGYLDNSNVGAVWVFTRSGGVWSQQGSKLVGTGGNGNTYQGYAVALSSDGNTALVGGYADSTYHGAVWVFTRTAGVWSQQGSKLYPSDTYGTSDFGFSVALSSDGNTALIGGIGDSTGHGAAWVFTRSAGVWTQQGSKLYGTGSVGGAQQGYSVSISADGNTAIVGADADNSYQGAVWIYTRSVGVWSQQGSKLTGSGTGINTLQGYSVSLSGDGTTAIFGGWEYNANVGAAWIFQTPSAPLPVEMSSLSATAGSNGVEVQWSTATETNSYGFDIERMTAGPASTNAGWSKVGFVAAAGTSGAPRIYRFTDVNATSGRQSYRIKQIDKDGTFKYSRTAEVEVASAPKEFTLGQNYPNPFNPSTTLEFTLQQSGRAVVKIYNVLGQDVATVFDQKAEAGKIYQAQFNAGRLPSGVYVSVLESGGKRLSRKMLLVK